MRIDPYLTFNGTCEAAFAFYAELLGGHVTTMMRFAGSPMEADAPPDWGQKIMHARLDVGGRILMGSDGGGAHYEPTKGMSLSIDAASAEEAERVFAALAEGGTVRMPLQQTFWAVRFGMLVDRFGIPWLVNCETPG